MRITGRTTRVERTEGLRFVDGEIRPVQFSSDGKQYRVDCAVIKWDHDGTGEWRLASITLKGQVLKKDGSDSRNRTEERMWNDKVRPAWLASLVDELALGGAS